ncbi:MAG: 30S ribosomal protein S21 [Candidatus Marinimicrobia bacterium]|nr:30S ribosomal protein S21 [Candidatus Neomarinimicrobiota bacterium]
MIIVNVRNGEPFEKALKRFKKKYEKAGVLRDVKRKSYYLKPSEAKRVAAKKSTKSRSRMFGR